MPYKKYPLLKKKNLKTIPIKAKELMVNIKDFGDSFTPGSDFKNFVNSLPNLLAAKELLEYISLIKNARKNDKPIMFAMGAHIIKVGLSPVIIDLMKRGWISAIAVNGAFMIHDFEIALSGATSENVAENLHRGKFGNTEETGLFLNLALKEGFETGLGAGEAVGYYLIQSNFPYNKYSILYNAYKLNIPVTVHSAIGTDFIHYHPNFNGKVLGELSEKDFLLFSSVVSKMSGGGIFQNMGSAVILPEVFLKALSFCTGQGIVIKNIYTAVFDFIKHYRPSQNVTGRPVLNGGKGFYFIGHHEIMIPLLAAILINSN